MYFVLFPETYTSTTTNCTIPITMKMFNTMDRTKLLTPFNITRVHILLKKFENQMFLDYF